jgi:hypothetical protein
VSELGGGGAEVVLLADLLGVLTAVIDIHGSVITTESRKGAQVEREDFVPAVNGDKGSSAFNLSSNIVDGLFH